MPEQKTILLIEDDKDLSEALRDQLHNEGFKVLPVYDGEEGIRAALAHHPDLILLDILLPKQGGHEVLKALREDDWGRSAKVILLTNVEGMASVSEAVKEGSYDYLVKTDWSLPEIVDYILQQLR